MIIVGRKILYIFFVRLAKDLLIDSFVILFLLHVFLCFYTLYLLLVFLQLALSNFLMLSDHLLNVGNWWNPDHSSSIGRS